MDNAHNVDITMAFKLINKQEIPFLILFGEVIVIKQSQPEL